MPRAPSKNYSDLRRLQLIVNTMVTI